MSTAMYLIGRDRARGENNMAKKHQFKQTFCYEETPDIPEDVIDMVMAVVPKEKFDGTVTITVTYNPEG